MSAPLARNNSIQRLQQCWHCRQCVRFLMLMSFCALMGSGSEAARSCSFVSLKPLHVYRSKTLARFMVATREGSHDNTQRYNGEGSDDAPLNRRLALEGILKSSVLSLATFGLDAAAVAEDAAANNNNNNNQKSTANAEVTDKIYLEFRGLTGGDPAENRIVIGLFGKDAPQSVQILKQLVSSAGYPAPCKPLQTKSLQKEQLEANKVYNTCLEDVTGVNYDLSTVWRVDRDGRIDVGAVAGRFVAREFPNFVEAASTSTLTHDAPGVVSVRRGNTGGFGFTIYPGNGKGQAAKELNQDNIVVGRVLQGLDTVVMDQLNQVPVVQSAKGLNYMGLTGGPTVTSAPSRACRYGGPLYCNELKPLKKILISKTGVLE